MYVHCHSCHWLQDDFWTWESNPLSELLTPEFKHYLLSGGRVEFDRIMAEDIGLDWKDGTVDATAYVVFKLEEAVRKIGNMHFRTEDDWEEYKKKFGTVCPVCGYSSLGVD